MTAPPGSTGDPLATLAEENVTAAQRRAVRRARFRGGSGWVFAARTVGRLILVIFGVLTLLFFLLRVSGDPASSLAGPDATAAEVEAVRVRLGLDAPLWGQYIDFLRGAVVLDFGNSYRMSGDSLSLVLEKLPATIGLIAVSYLFAILVALPLGMIAALTRSRIYARFVDTVVVVGQSVPVFAVAVVLVYLLGVEAGLVPTLADEGFSSGFAALIVPVFCLAMHPIAQLLELTRAGLQESMREDFIRTAESKGVAPWRVVSRHAMRPVGTALLNVTGLDLAAMLSGGVVVESIFAWPGIGPVLVSSVSNRDYPMVAAATFVVAVLVVLINFVVDLICRRLDPRTRKADA
ncbi:ABC transporter permease subunit [Nakamurella sp. YIM 132087]|uniref:ABC transporter permease subunit n=2 Tax=Nakamurella alba TaxID=2665158 RepID=A0A7K1FNQ2_9ACTN|nr:ABC transporter permease subunit [Nakamurella alba]